MKTWVAYNLTDLPAIAKSILESLGNSKVIAFDAPMGAGKTTIIQALLRAMGVENPDGSPTYAIINTYQTPFYGEILHFDVYRLKSTDEALDIGMEEMLYSGAFCFIEWAENVLELLPDETIWVRIKVNENQERIVEMEVPN